MGLFSSDLEVREQKVTLEKKNLEVQKDHFDTLCNSFVEQAEARAKAKIEELRNEHSQEMRAMKEQLYAEIRGLKIDHILNLEKTNLALAEAQGKIDGWKRSYDSLQSTKDATIKTLTETIQALIVKLPEVNLKDYKVEVTAPVQIAQTKCG